MARNRYLTLLRLTFRSLNWFEIFLILSIMTLAVISWVIKGNYSFNGIIAGISAILGVFCVVLGAKGAMANWLFGIVEGVLHVYICFCTHIYGDFLQRLFYNLPMQFFGWKSWKKPRTRVNNLIQCGIDRWHAYQWGNTGKGYWRIADSWILARAIGDESLRRAGYSWIGCYYSASALPKG